MNRFTVLVITLCVLMVIALLLVALEIPHPKFKVGQVVAIHEGPYFRIGYIDRVIDETGHVYFRYTDATEKNPAAGFWPEESLRALTAKECGR